ncbi:MAG: hypothetical protein RR619_07050, partial [Raoultibacter sp.]
MSIAFDASSLERSYAFLDDCPEYLLDVVITLPIGSLPERVRGARLWHDSLLLGTLPPEDTWPQVEVATPVRLALAELGLLRFCKDQPELVEILMKEILSAFSRQAEVFSSEVALRLRELEKFERIRRQEKIQQKHNQKRIPKRIVLDSETLERLRAQAMQEAIQPLTPDDILLSTWVERTRAWAEIANVFGDLGEMMGRGWDLSCGVLRQTGWLDLLRLRELIEQLPQLRAIVQALGRLQDTHGEESVAEKVL